MKRCELCGFKPQTWTLPQGWQLGFQSQGAGRTTLSREVLRECPPYLFHVWVLPAPLARGRITPALPWPPPGLRSRCLSSSYKVFQCGALPKSL